MRFFSWFFVCYIFFVPINQFMLDKNFVLNERRRGGKGFLFLSFLNELRDYVKKKKIWTTHICIWNVWHVIRHMNIYIVITRISSELNCLIIMHLCCCLIFVFLMVCYMHFNKAKDWRIHQNVTKCFKRAIVEEGRKNNSVQGRFSSPIISKLFSVFFLNIFTTKWQTEKRLYEKLLLTYIFLSFSIYFISFLNARDFSFVRVIYFYVFFFVDSKEEFQILFFFLFISLYVFCEEKKKLCIYFHKPKKNVIS